MTPHGVVVAVVASMLLGSGLALVVMRMLTAARARTMKRIHDIAIEVFRKGALREARKALVEIARAPHDRAHVERVAKKGVADSAMPAHLAEEGER